MYNVREILDNKGREVWSVDQHAPVFDALKLMAEKDCGALMVMDEEEHLVGVISERDYARKVALQKKFSTDVPVSEIMTARVITVELTDSLDHALALMSDNNIRHLPVSDGERLVGVLGIGELVHYKMQAVERKIQRKEKEVQQLTKYVAGSLAYR